MGLFQQQLNSSLLGQLLLIGLDHQQLQELPHYEYLQQSFGLLWEDNLERAKLLIQHTATSVGTSAIAVLICARWSDDNNHHLLRFLRHSTNFVNIPVVVLAPRTYLTTNERFLLNGADDFYFNPTDCRLLSDRLRFLSTYKPAIMQQLPRIKRRNDSFQAAAQTPPLKRAVDVAVSSIALVLLSPFLLLTAAAIRAESKGPILYKSKRVGAGYRTFNFWKFRSMYSDADQRLEAMRANNQYGAGAKFVKFTNDPRITRVGKFIRKYSIDELPQLYNILVGDMSLVGNRPLPTYEAVQLVSKGEDACMRFLAPAGLTGLWQVSKRGQNNMTDQERIALDVYYAKHQSFRQDAKIVLKTFTAFVQKENV
jgi:lipopolysaccharide/colanic/teichoic acid biosynthesis glycosyltransferase